MLHGRLFEDGMQYQFGAFNGKGVLQENNNDTPEGVGRLRFTPWHGSGNAWLKGLSFGGAYAAGRTRGGSGFIGRSESQSFVFFPRKSVNGQVTRANGELTWLRGPATIRAEFVQTNQEREGLGTAGANLAGVVGKGFMIAGTYLLTGEKRPENGPPDPRKPFLGKRAKGAGAWEVKFRYSTLKLDDGSVSNRAETFTTGINWYPIRFVKYGVDFNVEHLEKPVVLPIPIDSGNFFSILTRIQFRF